MLAHPPDAGLSSLTLEIHMESLIQLFSEPTTWVALATLIAMAVVLGIDNLIFLSILTNTLPEHQRERARRLGISLALPLRLGLPGPESGRASCRERGCK